MRAILAKLLMLFACCLASSAHGDSQSQVSGPTSCSTYMGKATINEVRIGASGTSSSNNQIDLFNSGNVAPSVWKTWQHKQPGGGTCPKAAQTLGKYGEWRMNAPVEV